MARILLAANSTWNIANFRSGLIRHLLDKGHKVTTVAPDVEGIEIDRVPIPHRRWVVERTGTNIFKDLSSFVRLARIVRDERPDIFLSFTVKPNIYGSYVCRLFGIPALPNVSGLGASFLGGGVARRAILLMYRVGFASAKIVFFQNPDDRDLFLRRRIVRDDQAVVVPGSGVNLSHFYSGEPRKGLRFLMVARLLGDKGVREYVEAARRVRRKFPAATFSLLGELDSENPAAVKKTELDSWIREGAVEYLGSTADVRPFIQASTAVVLPSYREGLPRTLVEAAAMGKPLIGTDVPGCRQLVRDGVTGFLCLPRDVDSLVAAIDRFAALPEDAYLQMGARARTMAEQEFDEKFVFWAYSKAVQSLAPDEGLPHAL